MLPLIVPARPHLVVGGQEQKGFCNILALALLLIQALQMEGVEVGCSVCVRQLLVQLSQLMYSNACT